MAVISGAVFAETTVTEAAVVEAALKNNPGLIAAGQMARAYDAGSHKEFFLENPMIGFDVMGVRDYTLDLNSSMQKYLTISQKVPFPLKYIWKASAAVSQSDLYGRMYSMKRFETENKAREAYYELYKTSKYIEITSGALSVLKQISNIAFAKYNQGMVSQQDVFKSDLETSLLENELLTLESQKETDLQRLRQIIADPGFLTNTAYSLEDPAIPELKAAFEEIKAAAMTQAPAIKVASADADAAFGMRNMAIADYLPDFSVSYKKSVDPGSADYELMVEAEVPLWFLNNQQSDIGQKWEMAESKSSALEDEKNRVIYEAKDHFEIIRSDYRLMDMYRNKLLPQAEAGLKSALASYQSKKMEFMTMLDSERMLLEMKKDYYMRLTEYLMHLRELEELTGGSLTKN